MALFKPFRGTRASLETQEMHDGYAYFCTDDGTFHIDYIDADGNLQRKQINAKDAETLLGHSIEEFLLASENGSFAHGNGAVATGDNSYAGGENTTASGINSSAEGKNTVASGMNSHAEGYTSQATGYGAHAENGQTKAIGGYSHAEGYLSEAEGDNSHSEGMKTRAVGNNSHASGQETRAEGANSFSAGHATQAIGDNSFATGAETKTLSTDTFVAGILAKAGGKAFQVSSRIDMPSQDGFVVGGYVVNSMTGLQTLFDEAAAQGQMLYYIAHIEATDYYEMGNIVDITSMPNTIVGAGIGLVTPKSDVEKVVIPSVGNYLMIMGCPELGDMDVGLAAFAEGIDTRAQHRGAHVEGISAIAAGPGAHGEGILTRAVHFGSHAQGFSTIAGGAYSHAGGYASEAGADHAFAHGEKLYAYGKNQFVVGQYNKIDNDALFIVGGGDSEENRKNLFTVKKDGSIAGGEATQAKGVGSFAHGQRVTADADYQATFGTHNEVNNTAALVIGNGNETTKSNAFEVQKDGNAFVKGNLYVGGTGSSSVSAKEVATAEAVSLIDRRITKVEDILASSSGEFIEDSDIAYVKVVPNNVARYASLNKVGGLGIRQNNFVNLFPATYNIAKGSTYDYYTFTYDDNGVITITDATPLENWEYEPYFSADFSGLCDVELSAGTYTLTFEAEGAPFALRTGINGESVQIGGYWDGEGLSSPYTFTLTETSTLSFDLGFACGGSYYCPPGEPTDFTYRIMLNKGSNALPWKAPSALGNDAPYIEPPKVTSIDVIGKNVFDYGAPRALGEEVSEDYPGYWYQANVTEEGSFILETLVIEGEIGPGTDVGETFTLEVAGINTTRIYPAGVYSVSSSVMCGASNQDEMYLALSIKLLGSNVVRTNLTGSNITIEDPFTITRADIVYKPATATSSVGGVSVPLTLAYGVTPLDEFVPFDCKTLRIPETIVSRDDYGLGVSNSRTVFSNYIDFEEKQFVKKCLSMELTSGETEFYTHLTAIDIETVESAMRCSDPSLVYEFSRYGPEWGCFRVYFESPGDADSYVAGLSANGTPIQMFFGTTIGEKIDISAELTGIDNYLAVETGGLIIFNNDQQAAVPSTIEYQSTLTQGELEEL